MSDTVEQAVRAILSDVLVRDEEEITPGADLRRDLEADSLDVAEIAVELEEKFNIRIDDSDGDGMKTVQDVVGLVRRKTAQ